MKIVEMFWCQGLVVSSIRDEELPNHDNIESSYFIGMTGSSDINCRILVKPLKMSRTLP